MSDRNRPKVRILHARTWTACARVVLVLALAVASAPSLRAAPDAAKRYVCPPCGIPCDDAAYDKPGTCPTCGMALVEKSQATAPTSDRKKVAVLVFQGVQIIDFTGPYEIFGTAGFQVYTVAESKDPVTTAMRMTVVPTYTFADAPAPDVLVVPGGGGVWAALKSDATTKWILDTSARASYTMSVCNGAFFLANAGLLDGLSATTTSGRIDQLRAQYPKIKVVSDRRFVDNGKIITTAGLSSGIDGALHVVGRIEGEGQAQQTALFDEYDWRPESGFARAALADMNIPDLDDGFLRDWRIVKTQGGKDHWNLVARGPSDLSAQQISDRLAGELAKANWAKSASPATATETAWTFTGRDGKPWKGEMSVAPASGEKGQYVASLTIARAKG
jgi:putative intracellular protease/amidase